jgi:hypothetical protein
MVKPLLAARTAPRIVSSMHAARGSSHVKKNSCARQTNVTHPAHSVHRVTMSVLQASLQRISFAALTVDV